MKTITIGAHSNGDLEVCLDGIPMRVEDQTPATLDELAAIDSTEDVQAIRHDTPAEVTVAIVCHAALRLYHASIGGNPGPAWSGLPGIGQASLIDAARAVHTHDAKWPADLHERWMALRFNDGWSYHPDPEDHVKKTHPMLVPFAQLPAPQKKRYRLFFTIANALFAVE